MYLGKLESKFDSTRLNQHQNSLDGVSERPDLHKNEIMTREHLLKLLNLDLDIKID